MTKPKRRAFNLARYRALTRNAAPLDPVEAIVDAFRTHEIVALGEGARVEASLRWAIRIWERRRSHVTTTIHPGDRLFALGGVAIRAAVERAGLDPGTAQIDDVLMGQVLQAGSGQAPARQAALKAGLPDTTSATTINRVCGSGLKSIMLAAAEIKAGDAEIAQLVVAMKGELEKFREQLENLE